MSDLHRKGEGQMAHGTTGNGGFERQDLGSTPIVAFIVTVVVVGVFVYYGIWGLFHVLDKYFVEKGESRAPWQQVLTDTRQVQSDQIRAFPEPRLEDNERTELNDTRYEEEVRLNSSGWIDQDAGVAHIPIDRAMQLIAQRGLPTNPQSGTVPPSPVNMAKQAAERSDTSNAPKQQKGKKQ